MQSSIYIGETAFVKESKRFCSLLYRQLYRVQWGNGYFGENICLRIKKWFFCCKRCVY